jgi:hypothetical protein
MRLTEYEQAVIREIARNQVRPSAVTQALETAGKPIAKLLQLAERVPGVRKIPQTIHRSIEEVLYTTLWTASRTFSEQGVLEEYAHRGIRLSTVQDARGQELSVIDSVADSFKGSNGLLTFASGTFFGAAATLAELSGIGVFGVGALVTADVYSSLTLLSRCTAQVGTAYGYSVEDRGNRLEVLAAMAPSDLSSDEGYLAAKEAALLSIQASAAFLRELPKILAERVGQEALKRMTEREVAKHVQELIAKEAPQLLKIIQRIAVRIGATLTEKELAVVLPFLGAGINGAVNLAFQQTGHTQAKDYFRRRWLGSKYGDEEVLELIREECGRVS